MLMAEYDYDMDISVQRVTSQYRFTCMSNDDGSKFWLALMVHHLQCA